jgi:hypothetical protein
MAIIIGSSGRAFRGASGKVIGRGFVPIVTVTYATTFTVSAPATMTVGTAYPVTVTPNGTWPTNSAVALSLSGITGTFTNGVGNGTVPVVIQFTPSAASNGFINASVSGMTSGGAVSVQATATATANIAEAFPMTTFPGTAGSPSTGLQAMTLGVTGATVDGNGHLNVPNYAQSAFIAAGQHADGVDTITYAAVSTKTFALMSFKDQNTKVYFGVPSSGTTMYGYANIPYNDHGIGPFTLPADISTATTVGLRVSNNGQTLTFQMNGVDTAATFTDAAMLGSNYLGLGSIDSQNPAATISRIDTTRPPKPADKFSVTISPSVASPTTQRTLTIAPANGPWPTGETLNITANSTLGVTLAASSLSPTAGSRTSVSTTLTGTASAIGAIAVNGTIITIPASATYLCVADKIDLGVAPLSVYVNQTVILTAAPANGLIWGSNESLTATLANIAGSIATPTKAPIGGTRIPVEWVVTLTGTNTGTLNVTGVIATSTGACTITAINRAPLSLALGLSNAKAAGIAAGTSVTTGHLFAPGDVPAGSRVKLTSGGTALQVQQDQESYWLGDGSLKFAVLTPKLLSAIPARGNAGSIAPFVISAEAVAPNRTPAFTLANYVAANDHKIAFRGLDATGFDFDVSVNAIVANGTAFPWDAGAIALTAAAASGATSISVADASQISVGQTVSVDGKTVGVRVSAISGTAITLTSGLPAAVASGGKLYFNTPICGWRDLGAGPNARRWHFWSFLKATTGAQAGQYHAQVRADLYVTAYGVNGPFEIDGHVEVSNTLGDHPAGTIGRDTVAHRLVVASASVRNGAALLYQFGDTGDSAGRVLALDTTAFNVAGPNIVLPSRTWLYNGYGFYLTTTGTMPTGLTANTPYWLNAGNAIRKDRINPSGAQTPNTPNEVFTNAGSGTFSCIPTFAVFPAAGAALAQFDTTPIYDAGTSSQAQAHVLPIYDREYLIKKSKGVLPYDTTQTVYARSSGQIWDRGLVTTVENYSPGQEQIWSSPWTISQYGDDPGDERVGPISNSEARICYQQDDLYNDVLTNSGALRFSDYTHWFKNIRSGMPLTYNNGHAKDGVQYPGLGPIDNSPSIQTSFYVPYLNRFNTPDASGNFDSYGPFIDPSHMPLLGYLPYIRTGRRVFLDKMIQLACASLATHSTYNCPVNGVDFPYCMAGDNTNQMRGIAWLTRMFANCEHVMPSNDGALPFIRDQLNDSALYIDAFFEVGMGIDPRFVLSGWWGIDFGRDDGEQVLYMHQFVQVVYGLVAWRDLDEGQRPGYRHFVSDFGRRNMMDLFDHDQGGGYYAGPNGPQTNGPYGGSVWMSSSHTGGGTAHAGAYQSPAETWIGNGITAPDQAGWEAANIYTGQLSFPFDTNRYHTLNLAAIGMATFIGVPKAQVMYDRLQARIGAGNLVWSNTGNQHYDNNTPQSYIPWCVASATTPAETP